MPNLRGNVFRHVNIRLEYLDRDGQPHDEIKPRPHRRHVPARARPPRRRAVRRPRRRTRRRWRPGSSSSATSGTRSSRGSKPWSPASARDGSLVSAYWCELAWLGAEEPATGVLLDVEGDRLVAVTPGVTAPPSGATRLAGLTLPGLVNAHSHAFHRALRGRTHGGYRLVLDLAGADVRVGRRPRPGLLPRLGDGHLCRDGTGRHHHGRRVPLPPRRRQHRWATRSCRRRRAPGSGSRCSTPATSHGGIGHGGVGRAKEGVQRRFGDGRSTRGSSGSTARPAASPVARVGAAIHSVRAVDPAAAGVVAALRRGPGRGRSMPTSASSRPRTRTAWPRTDGRRRRSWPRPARSSPRFTAVHATHVTDGDIELLGGAGCGGDVLPDDRARPGRRHRPGPGPRGRRSAPEPRLGLARRHRPLRGGPGRRARRATGHRPARPPPPGRSAGRGHQRRRARSRLAGRRRARAPELSPTSSRSRSTRARTAGTRPADAVAAAVFAATAADVTHVVVGGRLVVAGGAHQLVPDVPAALRAAIGALP